MMVSIKMAFSYVSSSVLKVYLGQQSRLLIPNVARNIKHLHFKGLSSKDIFQPGQTSGGQDLLLQNIKSAQHAFGVLEIVGNHYSIMNNVHVMQALRSLFELQKSKRSSMAKCDIINSPDFMKLCKSLKSQARALQLNDTIDALKIVSYIGVPSASDLVQVLLQLIKHNVNDLRLSHIVFLDFILDKSASGPLGSVLKMALPIVFETQLRMKFDYNGNLIYVVGMLQYAINNDLPPKSVEFLLEHIARYEDKLDTKTARSVVWSLNKLKKPSALTQQVLPRALGILASDIDNVPSGEIEIILTKLISRYSQTHAYYYHSNFFDACAMYVVKHNCGLELGTRILRKLSHIGHINTQLLDYLGKKVVEKPEGFINSRPSVLFSLVTGMSKADFRPTNWSCIKDAILKHRTLTQDTVALPWVKFAIDLASLDCFSAHLIEHIFEENFLKVFLDRENNFLDHLQLLLLYQAVVTLMPDYPGPWPPVAIIEKAASMNGKPTENFPLLGALEQGLGGSSYVHSSVYTKLGHYVDHAVVIRKGGFPVAINLDTSSSRICIEDFDVPSDCKIILILCFHPGCYAINCNRLKGHFSLIQKSLEAMDYGVISVSMMAWSQLQDHEKIPYIMQAINNTYQAHSYSTEVDCIR